MTTAAILRNCCGLGAVAKLSVFDALSSAKSSQELTRVLVGCPLCYKWCFFAPGHLRLAKNNA